ncbi:MAG: DUF2207 domain-containing protein [Phycisphaerae bacterium]|nr:DUF2207 domain-containing protein [Phycisphaerae bacterium]
MTYRTILLAVTVLSLSTAASAQDYDERVLSFHSDIVVNKDSSLTVTETIHVLALGKNIKRGIYRDFPIKKNSVWYRKQYGFEVLQVLRDGRPEPYHTESRGIDIRVYIGNKKILLKPGEYTYTLKYRTTKQIRYFNDHDELYWNVNGTGWEFPIDQISATVHLPSGVQPIGKLEGYTGTSGQKGQSFRARVSPNGTVEFRTTRPFFPGENLSIVVCFPAGTVYQPTGGAKFNTLLADNRHILVAAGGLVLVCVYFILAWLRVGRDPAKGIIFPRFEPPDGISPAAARFIRRMKSDTKCLVANVVSLAVKGQLEISDESGKYTLTHTRSEGSRKCTQEENQLRDKLFSKGDTFEMEQANHKTLQAAQKAMKKYLRNNYEKSKKGTKPYFARNTVWAIVGMILSVAVFVGASIGSGVDATAMSLLFIMVWLGGWSFAVFSMTRANIALWCSTRGRAKNIAIAVVCTLFSVPFLIGECIAIGFMAMTGTVWMVAIVLLIVATNLLFIHWLKQPTVIGREVMNQIDGFKMYLGTAERDRLETAGQPDPTPQLFEQYLPYAIALDEETAWTRQFESVLAAAAVGAVSYQPGWYHGSSFSAMGAGGFASSFSSSVTGAMSSPSSSGSGGGGSSGGGGGGGGGGGW